MAKQVRAGGAYIELGIRERIDKGLAAAEKKLAAFGKGAMVAGNAATGAATGFLGPLLMMASNAEEVSGKFDTVFGDSADAVRQWGNGFADTVGRSRRQVEEFMGNTQDLFVPIGFDKAAATELSKTVTGLAIDLASFNNKTDDEAMNDLQAALTGSGEVMKKYGVIVSEAAVKQELLNQGLDPKKVTEAQKVQARMNIILAGTTAAQGDAVRTGGSFANQLKRIWGNAENLGTTIGNHLLPPAKFLSSVFNDAAKEALGFAEDHKELIKNIVYGAVAFGAAGGLLLVLGAGAMVASFAFGIMATGFGLLTGALAFITGPGLLVVALIAAIGGAAYRYRDAIVVFAQEYWRQIAPVREAMAAIWDVVSTTLEGIKDALTAGEFTAAANILWAGVKAAFFTGAEHAAKAFEWLFGAATGWLKGIGDAVLAGNFALAFDIVWAQIQIAFASGSAAVSKTWALFVFGLGEVFGGVFSTIRETFYGVMQSIVGFMQSMMGKLRAVFAWIEELDKSFEEHGVLGVRLILPEGVASKAMGMIDSVTAISGVAGNEFGRREELEEKERTARREERHKALNAGIAASDAELVGKRLELAGLLAKADAGAGDVSLGARSAAALADLKRQAAAFQDAGAVDDAKKKDLEDLQEKGLNRGAKASKENAGSFSAMGAALLGLGGGNAAEETARNTKRTADLMQRMLNRDGGAPPAFS